MVEENVSGAEEQVHFGEDELIITRVIGAPREAVWKAWTEPERMKRWMGPKDYTTPVSEMDVRVGGRYFNCMRSPEGVDYCSTGEFLEVDPPERLVMTDAFADEDGNVVQAAHYEGMDANFPLELLIAVQLQDIGDRTRLTLTHSKLGTASESDRHDMQQGWSESFDKLEKELAGA